MAATTTTSSVASNVLDTQTQWDFSWFKYSMAAEVTQVPLNALSMDGNVCRHAEESPNQSQEQNLPSFLLSLLGQLANDEKPIESRRLEILKNTLDERWWLSLDNNDKSQVKTYLLKTLSSPVSDARSTVSQVIAKVAAIELPQNQWPQLIDSLLSNIHQSPADVKQATLETLEYLLEVSRDDIDQDHVDRILNAARQRMKASEGNNDVRLAATRALNNAFRFARARFNHGTMEAVREATLSPEVKIRQAAFGCLVSISLTHYEKLANIRDIFDITAKAVRQDEEPVALQAMEFWSSICRKANSDISCVNFIKRELRNLVPMLLETLLKPEEIISGAGRTCLGLVAQIVGNDIVTHVIPFIRYYITKPCQREAASYAFRVILEGPPHPLEPIIKKKLASIITQFNCEEIIRFLLHCMNVAPNVAEKACDVLSFHARDDEFGKSLLTYFWEHNLPIFLLSLSGGLANDEKPIESRRLAGLILKNTLDVRWLPLDNEVKRQVTTDLVKTLCSHVSDARSTVSQVIAKVACIELRQGWRPELVWSLLIKFARLSAYVKQATLETLEYLWKEVSPDEQNQDLVDALVGMIHTAVLLEMDLFYEGNNDVRLAATRALYNVLGLAQAHFNDVMERDEIMTAVLGAADFPDVRIRRAAFECLVSISSTYYEKLASYIQDNIIFNITARAVRQDEEPVALQAVEVWSSICHKEIDIWERDGVPSNFIQGALPDLVPLLLETLVNDQGEGAWSISMAGGRCLGLVARTVRDDIVPLVMPFIEEKITALTEGPNDDVKATAARTLGRILEFLPFSALNMTGATLGRIFESVPPAVLNLTDAKCDQIIRVLLHCMNDAPNVAARACRALYSLARDYLDKLSCLRDMLEEIAEALRTVACRIDAGESDLRTAARLALASFGL